MVLIARITVLNRFVGGDGAFSRLFDPASGESRVVWRRDSLAKVPPKIPLAYSRNRARQTFFTRFFFIPFTFHFDFLPSVPVYEILAR